MLPAKHVRKQAAQGVHCNALLQHVEHGQCMRERACKAGGLVGSLGTASVRVILASAWMDHLIHSLIPLSTLRSQTQAPLDMS
jgi:hypothetical protein